MAKKAGLYVGKLMQRFRHDSEVPTISLTSCLKPGIGFATVLDETPSHLPADIGDFKAFNLIAIIFFNNKFDKLLIRS